MPSTEEPESLSLDWLMLTRYIAGEATGAERAAVDAWLEADPIRGERLARLRAAGVDEQALGHAFNVDAAWKRTGVIARRTATKPSPRHPAESRWRFRLLIPFAAIGMGVVVAAVVLASRAWSPQQFREFSTTAGNRATVTLRDGTRLTLAPATRLRVPANFGTSARTVELEGEAYFAVVHDPSHPFAVHTGKTTITDIGTVFDVRGYTDEGVVRVAVAQGQVAVGTASLRAGDIATVSDTNVIITHHADVAAETAWLQGGLVFRATPLTEVVHRLGQMFDLNITIADTALSHQLVTATFESETPDEVLDEVTDIIGARFERNGRLVTIHRRMGSADHRQLSKPGTPNPLQTARRGGSPE